LKSLPEMSLLRHEFSLGFLFFRIAESAYDFGDVGRANEAKARRWDAYFKANRLLTQVVAERDREGLAGDLDSLRSALNGLSKAQQAAFAGVICDNARPKTHFVLRSEREA
jgi:hypothetical protein